MVSKLVKGFENLRKAAYLDSNKKTSEQYISCNYE
jgi:hypothetical protein